MIKSEAARKPIISSFSVLLNFIFVVLAKIMIIIIIIIILSFDIAPFPYKHAQRRI